MLPTVVAHQICVQSGDGIGFEDSFPSAEYASRFLVFPHPLDHISRRCHGSQEISSRATGNTIAADVRGLKRMKKRVFLAKLGYDRVTRQRVAAIDDALRHP